MTTTIKVPNSVKPAIEKALSSRLKEINEIKRSLGIEEKEITDALREMAGSQQAEIPNLNELNTSGNENRQAQIPLNFPFSTTIPKKGDFVLEMHGNPLSSRGILNEIYKFQPELQKFDKQNMVSLSGAFVEAFKRKRVRYFKIKTKSGWKFGLIEWKK